MRTYAKQYLPIAPNLINRKFNHTTALNQLQVIDITYIPTHEGWLCLDVVKDSCTCEIAGWAIEERMTKQFVRGALRSACWRKKTSARLLHHYGRASHYWPKLYHTLQ